MTSSLFAFLLNFLLNFLFEFLSSVIQVFLPIVFLPEKFLRYVKNDSLPAAHGLPRAVK